MNKQAVHSGSFPNTPDIQCRDPRFESGHPKIFLHFYLYREDKHEIKARGRECRINFFIPSGYDYILNQW